LGTDTGEPEILHRFKNQIYLAASFCDLLLDEMDQSDSRRNDLEQIRRAMQDAMALIPELARRITP
jgi:hypothetical protein